MKTEMNNAGFTKGNWSVNPETRLNEYGVICYSIDSDHGIDTLAETYGAWDGLGNAKLIAAAPTLFEVCQYIVDTYETDGMEQMQTRDEQFYKLAKQAINKAAL